MIHAAGCRTFELPGQSRNTAGCVAPRPTVLVVVLVQQSRHSPAQRVADFHVGLGIVVVVVAGAARRDLPVPSERAGIDRRHVALELGILPLVAVNRQLGVADSQTMSA